VHPTPGGGCSLRPGSSTSLSGPRAAPIHASRHSLSWRRAVACTPLVSPEGSGDGTRPSRTSDWLPSRASASRLPRPAGRRRLLLARRDRQAAGHVAHVRRSPRRRCDTGTARRARSASPGAAPTPRIPGSARQATSSSSSTTGGATRSNRRLLASLSSRALISEGPPRSFAHAERQPEPASEFRDLTSSRRSTVDFRSGGPAPVSQVGDHDERLPVQVVSSGQPPVVAEGTYTSVLKRGGNDVR
jgi:hypothetical protein